MAMLDIKVFAVDPGMTTGLAFAVPHGDGTVTYWTDEAKSQDEVLEVAHAFQPDVVIVERFATSGRISKYGLGTTELVGALYGLAWAERMRVDGYKGEWLFVKQTPQSRRSFLTDAQEHEAPSLHGRRTHLGRHERDAFAHLLEYIWLKETGRV